MIGIFKQKTPVNILLILVVGILIRLPYFKDAYEPAISDSEGILYREIITLILKIPGKSHIIFPILSLILIFIQSLQLNRLINNHRMMHRITYLPAISYVAITALIPEWNNFSAAMIANTFILIMFSGLFSMYHAAKATGISFNLGLMLGLCSLIYFPVVLFLPWLIIGLMIMRTVRINEWIICIFGVTSPYYFYAAYLLFTDSWSWQKLILPMSVRLPIPEQSLWLAASSFLLIVPFLIGGYYIQENLRKMLIQVRKNWSLVLIYLLFALFIPFVNNTYEGFENWILIVIPFAAFHACTYLYIPQRWIPFIIFVLTILFIIASQYRPAGI